MSVLSLEKKHAGYSTQQQANTLRQKYQQKTLHPKGIRVFLIVYLQKLA